MPEYIPILREEVENILMEHDGWTLAALNAMRKLDSFLKESQRMNHPGFWRRSASILSFVKLVMLLTCYFPSFLQSQSSQADHIIWWHETWKENICLRANLLYRARRWILPFTTHFWWVSILKAARIHRSRFEQTPVYKRESYKSHIWL